MSIRAGLVGLGKIARDQHLPAMEKTDEPAALKKILEILNAAAPQYYEAAE